MVRQKPTTDYSVNGAQITFTTALASTDTCFIIFLNGILLVKTPVQQYTTKYDDIIQWCL